MPSKVYYADMHAENEDENIQNKLIKLFRSAGFEKLIEKGDLTAIKAHFGEHGNTTFVPPWNLKPIVDEIKKEGGKPFLVDTNTLYNHHRKNAVDHLITANHHGFNFGVVGAPVIIADGITGRNETDVEINQKHFKHVKIAPDFINCHAMIVASHFKGHLLAGFGGAIKNMGMGCASVAGKREQHNIRPVSDDEKCTGCAICVGVCPSDAIEIVNGKSEMDADKCIGCGDCIAHCPEQAIDLDWETEIPEFTERLTEYAYGVWKKKKNKIGFINFVMNVTPDCDCFGLSEIPIVRDIGILASTDPVALDKACYDLVTKAQGMLDSRIKSSHEPGKDKFKDINEGTMGEIQFSYGEKIGMGSQDYELIDIISSD